MRWLLIILLSTGCAAYPLPEALNIAGGEGEKMREWKSEPPAWNEAVNYLYYPKADFLICAGRVKDGQTNNRKCAEAAWVITGEPQSFGFPVDFTLDDPF